VIVFTKKTAVDMAKHFKAVWKKYKRTNP